MSIRRLIARQTKNGIEAVYCHHDGRPEDKSPILTGHYDTAEKVEKLLALGDLSILGPKLGRKHAFESHGENDRTKEWCLAYGRDRGEKKTRRRKYSSETEFLADVSKRWADFIYIFRDGKWFFKRAVSSAEWIAC